MANRRIGIAVVVLLLAATGAWALASGGHAGHGARSASAGAGVCEMCQKPLVAARGVLAAGWGAHRASVPLYPLRAGGGA